MKKFLNNCLATLLTLSLLISPFSLGASLTLQQQDLSIKAEELTKNNDSNELDQERIADQEADSTLFQSHKLLLPEELQTLSTAELAKHSATFIVVLDLNDNYDLSGEAGKLAHIAAAKAMNQAFIDHCQKQQLQLTLLDQFDLLLAGLVINCDYLVAQKISSFNEVKQIKAVKKYYLDPQQTKIVGNRPKRDLPDPDRDDNLYSDYKGQGQIVAVLDSGFDVNHKAFYLKQKEQAKYQDAASLEAEKKRYGITRGKFINDKIPFAYNYADPANPDKLLENNDASHGQHVAGIIGAQPKDLIDQDDIKMSGIAPEAQLFLMRVFDDKGGTSEELYVRAIEDAVKLGASSINMSLGRPSESANALSPEFNIVLNKACEAGCLVNVAAGNDGNFGTGGNLLNNLSNPRVFNPDYGVISSPAVAKDTLAVAALEHPYVPMTLAYADNLKLPYRQVTATQFVSEKELAFADFGLGDQTALAEHPNLNGKIALIERGTIYFKEKAKAAKQAGASGIIFYNDANNGENIPTIDPETDLPVVFLGRQAGLNLLELFKRNDNAKIRFSNDEVNVKNPEAGEMAAFSSWGLSVDGTTKPEITAYGGHIYSTANNDDYVVMSGTSMATPKVAGAVALVNQRLVKEFPNLRNKAKQQALKNLLMNTAILHIDPVTNTYTSPRRQGAGVLDINAALHATCLITDQADNAYPNLGDLNGTSSHLDLKLNNIGNTDCSYQIKLVVNTDAVNEQVFSLRPRHLYSKDLGSISVKAQATENLKVDIDISDYAATLNQEMPNGYYLDGFVILTSDVAPTLSLPFTGFFGDFKNLPVLEAPYFELLKQNLLPYYWGDDGEKKADLQLNNFTHLRSQINNRLVRLGSLPKDLKHQDDFIICHQQSNLPNSMQTSTATEAMQKFGITSFDLPVISPNFDQCLDDFNFVGTWLRNSSKVDINIYNQTDNEFAKPLKVYSEAVERPKNYYAGNPENYRSYPIISNYAAILDSLPEDNYNLVVEVLPAVAAAKLQRYVLPFVIDKTVPEVTKVNYDASSKVLNNIEVNEPSGILSYSLKDANNKELIKTTAGTYDLSAYPDLSKVYVEIIDTGYNILKDNLANLLDPKEGKQLKLEFSYEDNNLRPKFSYEIQNDAGAVITNLNNVKPGKYKLVLKDLPKTYKVADEQLSFEVKETDPKVVIWPVTIKQLPTATVYVKIDVKAEPFDVGKIQLYLEDVNSHEQFYFAKGAIRRKQIQVPFGEYLIKAADVPTGYSFIAPSKAILADQEFVDEVTVQIVQAEAHLSAIGNFSDASSHDLRFKAINKLTGQEFNLPADVKFGEYRVIALDLPEGYYLANPEQTVTLASSQSQQMVTFNYEEIKRTSPKGTINFDTSAIGASLKQKLSISIKDLSGRIVKTQALNAGFIPPLDLYPGQYSIELDGDPALVSRYELSFNEITNPFLIGARDFKYVELKLVEKKPQTFNIVAKLAYNAAFAKRLPEPLSFDLTFIDAQGTETNSKFVLGNDNAIELYPGTYTLKVNGSNDSRYYIDVPKEGIKVGYGAIELAIKRELAPIIGYTSLDELNLVTTDALNLPSSVTVQLENANDITNDKGETKMPVHFEVPEALSKNGDLQVGSYELIGKLDVDEERFSNLKDIKVSLKVIVKASEKEPEQPTKPKEPTKPIATTPPIETTEPTELKPSESEPTQLPITPTNTDVTSETNAPTSTSASSISQPKSSDIPDSSDKADLDIFETYLGLPKDISKIATLTDQEWRALVLNPNGQYQVYKHNHVVTKTGERQETDTIILISTLLLLSILLASTKLKVKESNSD